VRSSERPAAPSDCTRAEVLAAPVCGSKLLPAGAMHGETDLGEGGAPGASARGRSGEVVLLTGQCPVVELPAHDQKAAAQQKAIGALDAGKRKALGPMLTAERVRCKRPKLSKADIEAALWLRGVQPARKSGGSGVANAPVLELQLLGLFGEDAHAAVPRGGACSAAGRPAALSPPLAWSAAAPPPPGSPWRGFASSRTILGSTRIPRTRAQGRMC